MSGMNAAKIAITIPNAAVMRAGVRRRPILPKPRGTSPSRDIANMIRVWP